MIAYLLETHIQLIKYTCIIHTWVGYFSELVLVDIILYFIIL